MRVTIMICFMIATVVGGCTDRLEEPQADDNKNSSIPSICYETVDEQKERQSERESPIENHLQRKDVGTEYKNKSMLLRDEENEMIDKIMERKCIKEARVATSDYDVIVSLLLREGYSVETIRRNVEDDVRAIAPRKQVIVFTDEYHWNG